ncbi:alpha/beta fold hydrolase [Pseudomonas sp. RW10S2]|uniref:alpha/beta hydrolase n=1 Tax=Pseudomonas sp. RW10S2 TaxID=459637 RepID=UPI001646C6AD|nr:alpha/beta fold hydrolase [Pseudomonas sp. RW10S2]MBC3468621.1 dienelactone hydrolase family protein [Pseudomonas sp. RW10S2]
MATISHDAPLVIESGPNPELSVIFVHGLGTSGQHYTPLVRQWGKLISRPVRFILPTAEQRPVRLCDGQMVSAWFDLLTADFNERVDVDGIRGAVDRLDRLIQGEIDTGQPSEAIFIAGFSQGGALSMLTAAQSPHRLGGALVLSGWLPVAAVSGIKSLAHLPIFIGHGTFDPVTPLPMAKAAYDWLSRAGATVDLHSYAMGHTIVDDEIRDIATWFDRRTETIASPSGP